MPRLPLACRAITPDDHDFLQRLYASIRAGELAFTDWDAARKEAFLAQQFAAQHHHYQHYYVGASFDLILLREEPIGRLYVARWRDEIRIVDIAVLPEYCNRGIGSLLIGELLREAAVTGKPLSIHVERFNRALGLYQRLGFRVEEDKDVYLLLVAQPGQLPTSDLVR